MSSTSAADVARSCWQPPLIPRGRAVGVDIWRADQTGNSMDAALANAEAEGVADIGFTRLYARRLRELGMAEVERRDLGWRAWWGLPFIRTTPSPLPSQGASPESDPAPPSWYAAATTPAAAPGPARRCRRR